MARAQSNAAEVVDQPVGGFEDLPMDREAVPDLGHVETGRYTLICSGATMEETGATSKTPGAPMATFTFRIDGVDNVFPIRDRLVLPLKSDNQDQRDGKVRRIRALCEALGLSVSTIGQFSQAVVEGMFEGKKALAEVKFVEDDKYGPQNNIHYWVS